MNSPHLDPLPAAAGKPRQKTGVAVAALILLAAAGAGWWILYGRGAEAAEKAAGRGARNAAPVSIGTAVAKSGDLEVSISAIGNVRALNTVTVRPLVGGTLQKIHFTEGAMVKEGDPLADIDPRPFEVQKLQAEGRLAQDEASLANAKRDLARYREAAEAVTPQQIDTAVAAVAQFEGAVATDKAAVDNAKLQLEYSRITSPISGRAGLRLVDRGNVVSPGDPGGIVVITQMQPVSVIFTVAENDLPALVASLAKNAAPKVVVLSRDNSATLAEGVLTAVDNQIDATTGTVKLRANFENADGSLFPNRFVSVRLITGTRRNLVLVPTVAVQISDKDRFVYVVSNDGTVERREVKTGDSDERNTEITEGVKAGETVVTEGLDRMKPGSKVRTTEGKPKESAEPAGKNRPEKATRTHGKGMHNA